jgi:O-antigen ligase
LLGVAIVFGGLFVVLAVGDVIASFLFYPFGLLQFVALSLIGEPTSESFTLITPIRALGLIVTLRRVLDWALGTRPLRFDKTSPLAWGTFLVLVLSLSLYNAKDLSAGLAVLFTYIQLLMMLVLIIDFVRGESQLKALLVVFASVGFLNAMYAIYQFHFEGYSRAPGIFEDLNPNRFGLLQLIVLCFSVSFFASRPIGKLRWFLPIMAIPIAYSLLLSFSRGAFVAGLGTALYYFLLLREERARYKLLLLGVVLVALSLAPEAVYERLDLVPRSLSSATLQTDSSIRTRVLYAKIGLEMALDHPLTGVGVGQFNNHIQSYANLQAFQAGSAHNMYIEMFAEGGIISLLLFLALLGSAFRAARTSRRSSRAGTTLMATISMGVELAFVAFLLYGFFGSAGNAKVAWLLIGFAVSLRRLGSGRRSPLPTSDEIRAPA